MLTNSKKPGVFRLMVTKPSDLALANAKALSVSGCSLAWRPDSLDLAVVEADPACKGSLGPIFGVKPAAPGALKMLVPQGADPAWQPIKLKVAGASGG